MPDKRFAKRMSGWMSKRAEELEQATSGYPLIATHDSTQVVHSLVEASGSSLGNLDKLVLKLELSRSASSQPRQSSVQLTTFATDITQWLQSEGQKRRASEALASAWDKALKEIGTLTGRDENIVRTELLSFAGILSTRGEPGTLEVNGLMQDIKEAGGDPSKRQIFAHFLAQHLVEPGPSVVTWNRKTALKLFKDFTALSSK